MAAERALAAFVHVNDPKGGVVVFKPGDTPPAWAQKAITNPAAWVPEPEPEQPAS